MNYLTIEQILLTGTLTAAIITAAATIILAINTNKINDTIKNHDKQFIYKCHKCYIGGHSYLSSSPICQNHGNDEEIIALPFNINTFINMQNLNHARFKDLTNKINK